MLEKDIENLIAGYPNEFFPNSGFTLVGQQVKLGKCYADVVFKDKYGRTVIVEVKRGILSRDASGQVMEYYGLLKSQSSDDVIELILCANIIPPERRAFLEMAGIECKELGINLINQVAEKVGYTFINKTAPKQEPIHESPIARSKNAWIFQANPTRYDILNALSDENIGQIMHWQINQNKDYIKQGDVALIWLSGKEAGIYAVYEILTNPDYLEEPVTEKKYWTDAAEKNGSKLRVKMKLLVNLTNKPVTKHSITQITGLKNLSILRQPQGTNFKVAPSEWQLLSKMI